MKPPLYALVAYVRNPVGEFVENFRRELHPEHPDFPAHLTILPPRPLKGTEAEALETIREVCQKVNPFDVVMGDVESFIPRTPTVFIQVAQYAYRMRELHDHLNTGALHYDEPWPYMPHLTIVKLSEVETEAALRTLKAARETWAAYKDSRRILLEELTFVREGRNLEWVDLLPIPLGRGLVSKVR